MQQYPVMSHKTKTHIQYLDIGDDGDDDDDDDDNDDDDDVHHDDDESNADCFVRILKFLSRTNWQWWRFSLIRHKKRYPSSLKKHKLNNNTHKLNNIQ